MGDISRHRDIYLNTREAIPPGLLAACKLSVADLTYLELGNYFTDVSQFRDPVFYIFAKQGIWRDDVLPEVKAQGAEAIRAVVALLGYAAAAALLAFKKPGFAAIPAGLGALPGFITDDMIAGWMDVDDWIDRMFGKPIEKTGGRKRKSEEFGYVGQFFEHFIEGITHLLFAIDVKNKVKGNWGKIDRIPQSSITRVYKEFFTQYYPHEHTDQPPYIWDASKRPQVEKWYCPSRRQHSLQNQGGVMNVVDKDDIQYLSQGLSKLENDFRQIKPTATDAAEQRRVWLVRLGKILHAIEDWYFHSNIVELIHLRGFKPAKGEAETDEQFLQRFVEKGLKEEPEYIQADKAKQAMYKRRLYRRLRYPEYERGDKLNSGGRLSRIKPSTLSLHHAYPAFPSQQDSTHTLLGALDSLEQKAKETHGSDLQEALEWLSCALDVYMQTPGGQKLAAEKAKARGVNEADFFVALATWKLTGKFPSGPVSATIVDVLREWLPLVVTLLSERERKRLVADVDPIRWPVSGPVPDPPKGRKPGKTEQENQLKRHRLALEPKATGAGKLENNYEQAARFIYECGFINEAGRAALEKAFKIDQESEKSHSKTPGSGGVLIQFAVKLQRALNEGERVTKELNGKGAVFLDASDDGSFNEIVGSHSLMSKDTLESHPFFNDARVLASVASQSVFHILLEEVSASAGDSGLNWQKILQHFIRYPVAAEGWERHALAFFRANNGQIPKYADLPELARLKSARLPISALEPLRGGEKAAELEEEYTKLEKELSKYRYP